MTAGAVTEGANVSFGIAFASGEARSWACAKATPHEQPDQTIIPAVTKRRNITNPRTPGCHHVFVRSRHARADAARYAKRKGCAREFAETTGRNHARINRV